MREQGEGIPRMFAEMEVRFLATPELSVSAHEFRVTLRNAPLIRPGDAEWLAGLQQEALSDPQARAMALARIRGQVSNSALRDASGLDTLAASAELRDLRDRGLLELQGAGSAAFYVVGPRAEELGGRRSAVGGHQSGTRYLWQELWSRDSFLDILGRFAHLAVDERTVDGKVVSKETLVFPRYHQLDVVRKVEQAARRDGAGRSYLIQHSAGSGKLDEGVRERALANRLDNFELAMKPKVEGLMMDRMEENQKIVNGI